nr:hypothetical protein [Chromobacterium sp. ASV5]
MSKLTEMLTDDDGQLEPAYIWGGVATAIGLGLQVYCTIQGKPFDLQGYGIGAGALIAGLGLGKKMGAKPQ